MKDWFKYEFGYVNVDSENMYLTGSGNWSEAIHLEEKNSLTTKQKDVRSSPIILVGLLILIILIMMLKGSVYRGQGGIGLIGLILTGGFFFYRYMRTDIGANFRIPLIKIKDIEFEGRNVNILFVNGLLVDDHHKLIAVDKKGLKLLSELKETRFNEGKELS